MAKKEVLFRKGDLVEVDLGKWVNAVVLDPSVETGTRLQRFMDRSFGFESVKVRVSQDAPVWAGTEVKIYPDISGIRPKSVAGEPESSSLQ